MSGSVSLDGAPLDNGSIRLTSVGGDQLVASGAMIQDGAFRIPPEKGLRAGVYHLEIYSPDEKAEPIVVRQRPGGPGLPVAPERIPADYNTASERSIEVTVDGDNHFVFEISSAPPS